uniref:Uncharacterized protein n=1 Tax=Cacopsylla melanoneura TaxID=428564 RepID=A0A8D9E9C7_9HEMI
MYTLGTFQVVHHFDFELPLLCHVDSGVLTDSKVLSRTRFPLSTRFLLVPGSTRFHLVPGSTYFIPVPTRFLLEPASSQYPLPPSIPTPHPGIIWEHFKSQNP